MIIGPRPTLVILSPLDFVKDKIQTLFQLYKQATEKTEHRGKGYVIL